MSVACSVWNESPQTPALPTAAVAMACAAGVGGTDEPTI